MFVPLSIFGVFLAGAYPAEPAITWQAPPGCPDVAEVRALVDSLLGDMPDRAALQVQVALRVDALPGGRWRLDAKMTGPEGTGQRRLEAERCSELAEAAALLTAIAIHPEFVPPPPLPDPHSRPVIVPPVIVPPEPPPVTAPDPKRSTLGPPARPRRGPRDSSTLHWPLGVRAGVGLGALPGVTTVLRLATGVRSRRWGVEVLQSFWLPREFPAAQDPRVGGKLWLWSAGLRGCGTVGSKRIEVPLCAGIEAGVLMGRGTGDLSVTRRVTSAWMAASAGPGLRVNLAPRWAVTVGVDLLVMLVHPRLVVVDRGEVCCDSPVGVAAAAGIELRLR